MKAIIRTLDKIGLVGGVVVKMIRDASVSKHSEPKTPSGEAGTKSKNVTPKLADSTIKWICSLPEEKWKSKKVEIAGNLIFYPETGKVGFSPLCGKTDDGIEYRRFHAISDGSLFLGPM